MLSFICMVTPERILVVENDPEISDFIIRQALQPLGYDILAVDSASDAIQQTIQYAPDLILSNLKLPGLSGKDLLAALNAQAHHIPVIIFAEKGQESSIIQAFRLGAADYLFWPAREAEIVSSVERTLKQVRERREREQLSERLKGANHELERRLRELTTIFAIGRAVTSITDQQQLFDKIVEGTAYVAEADFSWLLLRDDKSHHYLLTSHWNLPENWAKVGHSVDDGISAMVALSGVSLSIHGEPLKRFRISTLGESALAIPIKIKQEVIGLLVVLRQANVPFDHNMQILLEAVADYASISLVNARLFRALQVKMGSSPKGKKMISKVQSLKDEINGSNQPAIDRIACMFNGRMGPVT